MVGDNWSGVVTVLIGQIQLCLDVVIFVAFQSSGVLATKGVLVHGVEMIENVGLAISIGRPCCGKAGLERNSNALEGDGLLF